MKWEDPDTGTLDTFVRNHDHGPKTSPREKHTIDAPGWGKSGVQGCIVEHDIVILPWWQLAGSVVLKAQPARTFCYPVMGHMGNVVPTLHARSKVTVM